MTVTLDELIVRLDTNTRAFEGGMRRSEQVMRQFGHVSERTMRSMQTRMNSMDGLVTRLARNLGRLGVAYVGVATVRAFIQGGQAAITFADQIGVAADRLGVTAEALQEFRYAAEDAANIGVAQADTALQRFTRRLGEAANGTGELVGVLEQYNIAIRDGDGNLRSASDVLADYADAVQGAGSSQEQLRLAVRAFDSEGAGLVNVLRQGSEGMERYAVAAREAGILTNEQVLEAQRLDAEFTRLGQTISTNLTGAFVDLGPVLVAIVEAMAWAAREVGEAIRIIGTAADRVGEFFTGIGPGDIMTSIGDAMLPIAELGTAYQELERRMDEAGRLSIDTTDADFRAAVDRYNELTNQVLTYAQAVELAREAAAGGLVLPPGYGRPGATTVTGDPPPDLPSMPGGAGSNQAAEIDGFAAFIRSQEIAIELIERRIVALQQLDPVEQRIAELTAQWSSQLAEQGAFTAEAQAALPGLAAEYVRLSDELAHTEEVQRLVNEALAAGMDQTALYGEAIEVLRQRLEAGTITAEQFGAAVAHIQEKGEEIPDWATEAGSAIANTFGAMITGSQSAEEALSNLAARLADMVLQIAILQPLAEALAQTLAGLGGGKKGGGLFGSILGGLFGGGLAEGGPVSPGRVYMVGEKGPELFAPRIAGNIIPNVPTVADLVPHGRSGGGGGGQEAPAVNLTVNIDAAGADPAGLARVERAVAELKSGLPSLITGVMRDGVSRGGGLARDMGRR